MSKVGAITFDLWDTVFIDDSDEPKRKAQGLRSKAVTRRDLVEKFVSAHGSMTRELIDCAYDTCDAAFRKVWHEQHVTWSVADRLAVVLKGLDRPLPQPELDDLIRQHEEMEVLLSPDLVPGVEQALQTLSKKYTLVVISDAIFSPGWALRQILEKYQLKKYFKGFVFSDEAGCSKPAPLMFEQAADLAGCQVSELVHLGDREHNDIAGPRAIGARAVLITAALDRGSQNSQADAICKNYTDLPAIISSLDQA